MWHCRLCRDAQRPAGAAGRFGKLEYRGYDSAGVALTQRDGIRVVKSKGRLSTLRSKLEELALPQSSCGIGHTRWATHGEPSDVNSHPHSTPRVSIVHNGIIENYGALKERLIAKGYTFASETDTEVLVKLIDSCYQGEPLQALQLRLPRCGAAMRWRCCSRTTRTLSLRSSGKARSSWAGARAKTLWRRISRRCSSTPAATACWRRGYGRVHGTGHPLL